MSDPLRVRIAVLAEAQPVLDALASLHIDVGSIGADRFDHLAPPGFRLLCVATAEPIDHIACALRHELAGNDAALELTNRVVAHPLPLDMTLLVFLDIPALAAQ